MKLTNKSLKLAGALSLALIGASPMALSTAASAAPVQAMQRGGYDNHKPDLKHVTPNDRYNRDDRNDRDHNRYGYDDRRYGDRFHKPPPKFERITRPHFARHFHKGQWNFKFGHWIWIKGFWTR